jgi:CRISPR/Cas system endoribonuclease Cas6 (RAMP superfamily)
VLAVKDWEKPRSGPGKSACDLIVATAHDPVTGERTAVYRQGDRELAGVPWGVSSEQVEQAASRLPQDEITVDFLTPTRLRLRGQELDKPDFHALVASLARRIEALHLYHDFPALGEDVADLIAAADGVELVGWSGDVASQQRYSSRQRQSMRMEGFVGRVTYAGDLTPFLVLLKLGELIHVGKGAVFGLGQMRIVG